MESSGCLASLWTFLIFSSSASVIGLLFTDSMNLVHSVVFVMPASISHRSAFSNMPSQPASPGSMSASRMMSLKRWPRVRPDGVESRDEPDGKCCLPT